MLKPALYGLCTPARIKKSIFFIFLFSLFSFWGADWFGYYIEFKSQKGGWNTHLEDFYKMLIDHLSYYLQFRAVIWGLALVFIILTLKRIDVDKGLALYCFVICSLIWFSYSRVSLAMATMIYGSTFLVEENGKINMFSICRGIIFLGLSIFFHKSAIFGVGTILISYFCLSNPSKFMRIGLICFPFLIIIVSGWLIEYMQMDATEESMSQTISSGQNYMNQGVSKVGPAYIIQRGLEWTPKYILAYMCFKFLNLKEKNDVSERIKLLMITLFFIMLFSSIFLFDLGFNTSVIFGRFQRFAIIPMFIVISYFYKIGFNMKLTKKTLKIAFVSTVCSVSYCAYNTFFL
jgi:hypothetical protein